MLHCQNSPVVATCIHPVVPSESLELRCCSDGPGTEWFGRRGARSGVPREAAEHDAVPEMRLLLLLRRALLGHRGRHSVSCTVQI